MSTVTLERLVGAFRPYSLTIPVEPAPARPITLGANVARNYTTANYSSEVVQSKVYEGISFAFMLCDPSFFDTIDNWWDFYVIDARQLWCYVTYEPFSWVGLPMTIMNESLGLSWRTGQVRFDFNIDLQERFLAPGEGDEG